MSVAKVGMTCRFSCQQLFLASILNPHLTLSSNSSSVLHYLCNNDDEWIQKDREGQTNVTKNPLLSWFQRTRTVRSSIHLGTACSSRRRTATTTRGHQVPVVTQRSLTKKNQNREQVGNCPRNCPIISQCAHASRKPRSDQGVSLRPHE